MHPGWPALMGRDAVMESWRAILGNPAQRPASVYGAECRALAPDMVAVICYEHVADAHMVATNLFVEEGGRPRLVFHQAGYCARPPQAGAPQPRPSGHDTG